MRAGWLWLWMGCSADRAERPLPETLARITGSAPVVIELAWPEGVSPRDRQRWLAAVAAVQDEARACAPGLVEDRDYPFLPALSGEVDARTLDRLARCAVVTDVAEPRRFELDLAESAPLVQANTARASTGFDGTGTAVAILDTGVDYTHPDLGGCLGAGCKVAFGYDYADEDEDPADCMGHGTNVAGIAAGASGIAPGASIFAMKIAEDTDCYAIDERAIASAMNDSVDLASSYLSVSVNMSFGAGLTDEVCDHPGGAMGPAIKTAYESGLSLTASAGNDGDPEQVGFPACMSAVLGVANSYDSDVGAASYCLDNACASTCTDAATSADALNCSSNGGAMVDLAAPGTSILAAGITMSGTSQAGPHVAGALALLGQAVPGATPDDRYAWVLNSDSTILDTRSSTLYGYPRLDLISAFQADASYLEATIVTLDDDALDGTDGDGDGQAEAGETVGLNLEIWNGSPGSLTELTITAWTADPDLVFDEDEATLSGLAPGETAAPEDSPNDLVFSVPATCVTDHTAAFTVGLSTADAGRGEHQLSVELRCVIDDDVDGWLWTEDCDEADADVNPEADETCNAVDDDCDGLIDEDDASDAAIWYADADADGYGDPDAPRAACAQPDGTVANLDDCDDGDKNTYPGTTESCDEADNDCDDEIDEGEVCARPEAKPDGPASCGCANAPGTGLSLVGLLLSAIVSRRRSTVRRLR